MEVFLYISNQNADHSAASYFLSTAINGNKPLSSMLDRKRFDVHDQVFVHTKLPFNEDTFVLMNVFDVS